MRGQTVKLAGLSQDSLLESAIENLKNRAREFAALYDEFIQAWPVAQNDPELREEWLSIKSIADRVRYTIEWINQQVDSAVNWLRNVTGLSGVQTLSAIPLIPIAYVTGALAALGYVINRMIEFNRKVALVRERLAPGSILSPEPSIIGETGNLLKWVVIGGALYFLVKPWIERKMR